MTVLRPFEKHFLRKEVGLGLAVFAGVFAIGVVVLYANEIAVFARKLSQWASEYLAGIAVLVLVTALHSGSRRLVCSVLRQVGILLRRTTRTRRRRAAPGKFVRGRRRENSGVAPASDETSAGHRMWCGEWVDVGPLIKLERPWVIDGDTIDDRATGIRYRLANIDAPETGENAKCDHERRWGERASAYAVGIVRNSTSVTARNTSRTDCYGRCVAFVFADGKDLGEILVARGFAKSWRGRREPWCGAQGLLAQLAMQRREPFSCSSCPLQDAVPPA